MGKCKVLPGWFLKYDGGGYKVNEWAKKHSDSEVYCTVCSSVINIQQKGFQAITQHAGYQKHMKECATKLSPRQLHLASGSKSDDSSFVSGAAGSIKLYNIQEGARSAELKWVMKCVASNYSAKSCDDLSELFKDIFPCSNSANFSLSRTKVRYLLTDALGPYFKKQIVEDVGTNYFTVMFDETTNVASKKELETMIRYWSETHKKIVCHHLECFFIGRATANDLFEKINESVIGAELHLNHLLMLGNDGPNVNKKVYQMMSNKMRLEHNQRLVDIGTCNLHIAHNAFNKGLAEFGEDVSDLAFQVHDFFDGWPVRVEFFESIQVKLKLPVHRFIRHVPSRWLTLQYSCERLIEQYPALLEYFLNFIPKHKPELMKSGKYKKICSLIRGVTMKAEVLFVLSCSKIYSPFTCVFQREEPLIHCLYSALNELIMLLLGRICQNEKLPNSFEDIDSKTFFELDNLLPVKEILHGEAVEAELRNCKRELNILLFTANVQKHFMASAKYLLKTVKGHTPLKHFRCLKPEERFLPRSCVDILQVAKCLPINIDFDFLENEWRLLQLHKTVVEGQLIRIDSYWNAIFEIKHAGIPKFPTVAKVVKAALALSHGNADVERSFSFTGKLMTDEKSNISVRTLNSMLTVKTVLKQYDNKAQYIIITKELLQLARVAGVSYHNYLEEQKRKKEIIEQQEKEQLEAVAAVREKRKKVEEEDKILKQMERELSERKMEEIEHFKTARKLMSEAKERLSKAVEKQTIDQVRADVRAANAMLVGAFAIQEHGEKSRKKIDKETELVGKRKSSLITSYLLKKPKN